MNYRFLVSIIVFCALAQSSTCLSQDRLFTYTYQSGVLSSGLRELEVWTTVHHGRANYYRALKNRIEFEVGLGSNVQTSFYINTSNEREFVPGSTDLQSSVDIGFSNEWKWKLMDPVADPVGLALYTEVGINTDEFELEGKLIVDKVIGSTTHALNIQYEQEWETSLEGGELETEEEGMLTFNYGLSYELSSNFNLGLEARLSTVIEEGELEHSALFLGPNLSYHIDKFWMNLTILPQVSALKGATLDGLVLHDMERLEGRLIFSYAF